MTVGQGQGPTPEQIRAAYPPLPYHHLHLAGSRGRWRAPLGVLTVLFGMFVLVPVLVQIPFAIGFAVADRPVLDSIETMLDFTSPTPLGLAYLNIVLAGAIPLTWLVTRVLHGLKPGWLTSVVPGMRWRFFVACLGLSVLALVATVLVSLLIPSQTGDAGVTGEVNTFTRTTRDFLLVVVLLTPLQAAGEEYAFRGYLTQACGGMFSARWVAVVVPAVLFALAHGAGQSVPVFFDRLAFGLVAGVLVVVTGGLEAAIAMHVLNNWLAFGLALAFGSMTDALNPPPGSWWSIPATLTQSLVYLVLAVALARRMGLATKADSAVLLASRGRVYGFPASA